MRVFSERVSRRSRPAVLALVLASATFLAACQSSEDRAEEHYQSALALVAEGDLDRAVVEYRNVFRLDGDHLEARRDYAALLRRMDRLEASVGQYLRLLEQSPDAPDALIALSEMAIEVQDWVTLKTHGTRALEVAGDRPEIPAIALNLRYLAAIEADDAAGRREVAAAAAAQLVQTPGDLRLYRITIDAAIRGADLDAALAEVEAALAAVPDNRELWTTRIALLVELNRPAEVETQLLAMRAQFPQDQEATAALLEFYVKRGEEAKAEALLRDLAAAATDPEEKSELQVALVQLVTRTGGPEAALAEIDRILAGSGDPVIFRMLAASLRFDGAGREAAIADLQALVEGAEPSDRIRGAKILLARMLDQTDNRVGARVLIEEVLAEDPSQVEALKVKAGWLIDEDKGDEAIGLLRTVLDLAPEDVAAMTLSAEAHARNGDQDLARDFLALAVEASQSAPGESLRYAATLIEDERFLPAEEVLIKALRRTPNEPDLLFQLGDLYIRMEDWPRAEQVEATLASSTDPEIARRAQVLTVARLQAQGQGEAGLALIEELAVENAGDLGAQIAVVRARLLAEDIAGGLAYAEELALAHPENTAIGMTLAAARRAAGDIDGAVAAYRTILARAPGLVRVWLELIRTETGRGDEAAARAALAEGLAAAPDAPDLLWAEAGYLERDGDIDAAIATYERIYAEAPDSLIAANNLASLLATWRDDAASLDRAFAVARRLRGLEVPAFQDTYGWIAYRRGQFEEALAHLEPAAAALPGDPVVQVHLGLTYAALNRRDEALAQLRLALEVAGPGDSRPQIAAARDEIARLEAAAPPAP
jgi:cellulose synthase operon protein C